MAHPKRPKAADFIGESRTKRPKLGSNIPFRGPDEGDRSVPRRREFSVPRANDSTSPNTPTGVPQTALRDVPMNKIHADEETKSPVVVDNSSTDVIAVPSDPQAAFLLCNQLNAEHAVSLFNEMRAEDDYKARKAEAETAKKSHSGFPALVKDKIEAVKVAEKALAALREKRQELAKRQALYTQIVAKQLFAVKDQEHVSELSSHRDFKQLQEQFQTLRATSQHAQSTRTREIKDLTRRVDAQQDVITVMKKECAEKFQNVEKQRGDAEVEMIEKSRRTGRIEADVFKLSNDLNRNSQEILQQGKNVLQNTKYIDTILNDIEHEKEARRDFTSPDIARLEGRCRALEDNRAPNKLEGWIGKLEAEISGLKSLQSGQMVDTSMQLGPSEILAVVKSEVLALIKSEVLPLIEAEVKSRVETELEKHEDTDLELLHTTTKAAERRSTEAITRVEASLRADVSKCEDQIGDVQNRAEVLEDAMYGKGSDDTFSIMFILPRLQQWIEDNEPLLVQTQKSVTDLEEKYKIVSLGTDLEVPDVGLRGESRNSGSVDRRTRKRFHCVEKLLDLTDAQINNVQDTIESVTASVEQLHSRFERMVRGQDHLRDQLQRETDDRNRVVEGLEREMKTVKSQVDLMEGFSERMANQDTVLKQLLSQPVVQSEFVLEPVTELQSLFQQVVRGQDSLRDQLQTETHDRNRVVESLESQLKTVKSQADVMKGLPERMANQDTVLKQLLGKPVVQTQLALESSAVGQQDSTAIREIIEELKVCRVAITSLETRFQNLQSADLAGAMIRQLREYGNQLDPVAVNSALKRLFTQLESHREQLLEAEKAFNGMREAREKQEIQMDAINLTVGELDLNVRMLLRQFGLADHSSGDGDEPNPTLRKAIEMALGDLVKEMDAVKGKTRKRQQELGMNLMKLGGRVEGLRVRCGTNERALISRSAPETVSDDEFHDATRSQAKLIALSDHGDKEDKDDSDDEDSDDEIPLQRRRAAARR